MNELGKLPPQATDLEEVILGAIMIERDAIDIAAELLSVESFYKDSNKVIFKAILDLLNKSSPIDLMTATEQLRKNGTLEIAGGAYRLAELTTRVNSAANIEEHSRYVMEMHMKRELIKVSSSIQLKSYDSTEDVFAIMDEIDVSLSNIQDNNTKGSYKSFSDVSDDTMENIIESRDIEITGVELGFKQLDEILGGCQDSDLIIIAGRPGMGKTAKALCGSVNAAKKGNPVAVFSLEMSSRQLMKRVYSSESLIDASKIKNSNLHDWEAEKLTHVVNSIRELPIFIDDTESITLMELRSKCRQLKRKHDISMIVIDYLQLITMGSGFKGNREQEISTISRGLKMIAKELEVPVIALAQLSRAVEQRGGNKIPMLSDLRESGAIEQDADVIIFTYRPEYYDILEDENGDSLIGKVECIIAKHRNGSTGSAFTNFTGKYVKFHDNEIQEPMQSESVNSFPESDIDFDSQTGEVMGKKECNF